jgi:hypothetical protein
MTQEWHYVKDGQRHGPITARQLKGLAAVGDLQPTDLVWTEVFDEWKPANVVKGLFPDEVERKQPPPVIPVAPVGESQQENDSFWSLMADGGKYATALGGICGLAGDFLTPLGPINGYLALTAGLCCVTCFVLWRRLSPENRSNWELRFPHQAMVFSAYLLLAFGFWSGTAALSDSTDKGLLGGNVAVVAKIQKTLLGIEATVQDIKSDTGEILLETKKISGNIDELGKLGGIIKNAATPKDVYHNARFHELEGDFKKAFTSYIKYVTFNQEFVDPYLSYLELLRTQRGQAGAEEEFRNLRTKFPNNPAREMAAIMLLSGEAKRKQLDQFINQHPGFGPAYLYAANAYSAKEIPQQSAVAVAQENDYLLQLLEMEKRGNVQRYYLDKNVGSAVVADARGRLNMSNNEGKEFSLTAVSPGFEQFSINDYHVTSVYFKFDGAEWSEIPAEGIVRFETPLGKLTACRPPRDKLLSYRKQQMATNPKLQTNLHVKYIDNAGRQSKVATYGPFPVSKILGWQLANEETLNGVRRSLNGAKADVKKSLGEANKTFEKLRKETGIKIPKIPSIPKC